MKTIPLTQGKIAIVDDADFERINQHGWYAHKGGRTYYAERCTPVQNGKQGSITMHREILGLPKSVQADHKNGCGLDNRKDNLRPATHQQNQFNQHCSHRKKSSQYKGVFGLKHQRKWRVQIQFNNKKIHVGYFDDEIKAAKAYDAKVKELFGEFALLNF